MLTLRHAHSIYGFILVKYVLKREKTQAWCNYMVKLESSHLLPWTLRSSEPQLILPWLNELGRPNFTVECIN